MGRFCQKEQIPIRSETHGQVSTSSQLLTKCSVGKQITILHFFSNEVTTYLTEEV